MDFIPLSILHNKTDKSAAFLKQEREETAQTSLKKKDAAAEKRMSRQHHLFILKAIHYYEDIKKWSNHDD